MKKYVICILATLLIVLFGSQSVFAWDTHAEMTRLTNFNLDKKGNLSKLKQTIIEQSPQPDKHKSLDHSIASRQRAIDACNAAVRNYNSKKYQDSAVQLGHCFHYLQDTGDPTKHIDDIIHVAKGKAERKEQARFIAKSYLAIDSKTPITAQTEWKTYYPEAYSIYFKNLTRVPDILDRVSSLHKGTIGVIGNTYRKKPNENEKRLLINRAIIRCIANTVAAQDRILELLVK